MSYRISGLDPRKFQPLFELNDETLKERSVGRIKVEQEPGYPCRITLRDASIGERDRIELSTSTGQFTLQSRRTHFCPRGRRTCCMLRGRNPTDVEAASAVNSGI